MLINMISKMVWLVCGLLYPAYCSFIVVRNKDPRGYVQWMMYWIVFAFYSASEVFTDIFLGPWFPFYYEFKLGFLIWLMSPKTCGAGYVYRRFVHPKLMEYEPEIESTMSKVKMETSSLVSRLGLRIFSMVRQTATDTIWASARAIQCSEYPLFREIRRTLSLETVSCPPEAIRGRLHTSASLGSTPASDHIDFQHYFAVENVNQPEQRVYGSGVEEPLRDGDTWISEVEDDEDELFIPPPPRPTVVTRSKKLNCNTSNANGTEEGTLPRTRKRRGGGRPKRTKTES